MTPPQKPFLNTKDTKVTVKTVPRSTPVVECIETRVKVVVKAANSLGKPSGRSSFAPNFKILNFAFQNSFVYFVSFVIKDLFAVDFAFQMALEIARRNFLQANVGRRFDPLQERLCPQITQARENGNGISQLAAQGMINMPRKDQRQVIQQGGFPRPGLAKNDIVLFFVIENPIPKDGRAFPGHVHPQGNVHFLQARGVQVGRVVDADEFQPLVRVHQGAVITLLKSKPKRLEKTFKPCANFLEEGFNAILFR